MQCKWILLACTKTCLWYQNYEVYYKYNLYFTRYNVKQSFIGIIVPDGKRYQISSKCSSKRLGKVYTIKQRFSQLLINTVKKRHLDIGWNEWGKGTHSNIAKVSILLDLLPSFKKSFINSYHKNLPSLSKQSESTPKPTVLKLLIDSHLNYSNKPCRMVLPTLSIFWGGDMT